MAPLLELNDVSARYGPVAALHGISVSVEDGEIVITRHGRPAGVLIGFKTEDDWFDYRLENDPRFLRRVEAARASLRAGRGVKLEDLDK